MLSDVPHGRHGMRFTIREAAILDKLIIDCDIRKFDEATSLLYIEQRFKTVSRDVYYARKKKLESNEQIKADLQHHIQIGFVIKQNKMIEGIETALALLQTELYYQSQQRDDPFSLVALAKEINELTMTLRQLNVDLPYVARMKEEVDRAMAVNQNRIIMSPKALTDGNGDEFPESALVIGVDSIAGKPSEAREKQDNGEGDDAPIIE
jgi:hypothetical protein